MESLFNSISIQELSVDLPYLKERIDKSSNEFNNYLQYLKDEKFIKQPNETEEIAIKRAESIYDRLDEILQRRRLVLKSGKETIDLINNIKLKIENVLECCENDEDHLANANNQLIDEIVDLEKRKMNKEIEPLQNQINLIKQRFDNKKNEWGIQRISFEEIKKRKQEKERKKQDEIKKKTNNSISLIEIEQIEKWSGMKIGNIIFDSNIDKWDRNTSVFDEKVLNRSNLIFIIEDDDGNKFGGYVSVKIDKCDEWITDSESFVFSLKSNGRLNGMLKFKINESKHDFHLDGQSSYYLFRIGGGIDILVNKESNKNESCCSQYSFNYNKIDNALCGKNGFTPKRITVIQLI